MTLQFAKSLKQSKEIDMYRKLIFSNVGSFKPFNVSAALEHIIQTKKIVQASTLDSAINSSRRMVLIANITHSLHGLRLVNVVAAKFEKLRKDEFNKSNQNHIELLNKLWSSLRPNIQRNSDHDPLNSIVSISWSDIGFQGKDPSTDFRGMGMLGLHQLVYFSETKPEVAKSILDTSNDPKRYFPFAATGINITAFLLQLLNETRMHRLIFENLETLSLDGVNNNISKSSDLGSSFHTETINSTCNVLNEFYCFIFEEFITIWISRNPKSVLEFPSIFSDLQKDIRNNFPVL